MTLSYIFASVCVVGCILLMGIQLYAVTKRWLVNTGRSVGWLQYLPISIPLLTFSGAVAAQSFIGMINLL